MDLKVLFVHPNNKLTGQEFSLLERMAGLRDAGVDSELLLPDEGDFADKVRAHDFKVQFYPLNRIKKTNPFPFIKTVLFIKRILKQGGGDIIHCSGIYPNQYCLPAARLARVPVVGQVTTTIYNDYDLRTNFVKRMDLIITCSEAAKAELTNIEQSLDGRVQCVYDGIADNQASISLEKIDQLRNEFDIQPDELVVGQLSEVIPRKGCDYFVDMAAIIKKDFPKVKFLIVGKNHEDEYEAMLRAKIKAANLENDVILTGFRKDFYAFLKLMDVSVLASLAEGLGRVIVETQYMAKPIVATAVSGNVEAIEDGKSGFLVPSKNHQSLSAKVLDLLKGSEQSAELGNQGRQSALKRFSIEAHAQSMRKIYLNLLGR